ncbi:MAG: CDP-diacylglycerol--glycerol-3-phosphate 3-phosphatidyltransferase [Bacilli bacterium]|nr:CDP-diacylglycerol--glycerol-3-phosphate 3-phosphatidyltransferase [Bacilli bacterium]
MNVANKLTMLRIFLTIILITILLFPFYMVNVEFPKVLIGTITVDVKYLIAAGIFLIASVTDFLDGFIARKYNMVTDFGKMVDAIADKMLVNSTLIILSSQGFVAPIITVIIIFRDTVVDTIKMLAASKGKVVAAISSGKIKTLFLMVGIILTLCYNLPFELFNLDIANFLLVTATLFSVISGVQYYLMNKEIIFAKPEKVETEENK